MKAKMKTPLIVLLGLIILGSLFIYFKPKQEVSTQFTQQSKQTPEDASPTPQKKDRKEFVLELKNKKLISGPETITVQEDDEVVIKITSDEEDELHLHGYDKSVDLKPGEQNELTFKANLTGRYPYELEDSKIDIGALEVQPK